MPLRPRPGSLAVHRWRELVRALDGAVERHRRREPTHLSLEGRRRPDQIGVLLPGGRIGIASVRASGQQEATVLQKWPMYAYIPVKDLKRAREFYEQKLGFKPKEETGGGVVYEFAGGTGCFMYPTPNAGTSKASQAFWQVGDVEKEVAELKARGVKFEEYDMPGLKTVNGIAAAGGAKSAWFKDVDGNILALVQNA